MKRWHLAVIAAICVAGNGLAWARPAAADRPPPAGVAARRKAIQSARGRLADRLSPPAEPAGPLQAAAAGDAIVLDDPVGALTPKADLRQVTVASAGGASLQFTMAVEQYTNPATEPAWTVGFSYALWLLDTSGDDEPDVTVGLYNDGEGVVGEVWDYESGIFICVAGASSSAPAKTYTVIVSHPGCLGDVKQPGLFAYFILDDPALGELVDFAPNDGHLARFTRPNPGAPAGGYAIVSQSSGFQRFGASPPGAQPSGTLDFPGTRPVIGAAGARLFLPGLWGVTDDGQVQVTDAPWWDDLPELGIRPNQPIVGMAVLPDGLGYWLVGRDGGIFAFGDAQFHGSTGGIPLNQPIVGMASTPSGLGYWLVASDGGIFAYGDASFYGSTGSIVLNKPVVGMAAGLHGEGYWLVASDGGIFSYGLAFHGSTGSVVLQQPIVGMASTRSGGGYRFIARDGGLFSYGDAEFHGSGAAPGRGDVVGLVTA